MKKITKKEFEKILNEKFGVDTQKWGNGSYAAKKRPYGTYLRSSDKETFDRYYDNYVKTGDIA